MFSHKGNHSWVLCHLLPTRARFCQRGPLSQRIFLLVHLSLPRNELVFYSPQGHRAAFALPPVAVKELAKPRPALRDTTADLEEIMAYGEESKDGEIYAGSLSHRWEPDVRVVSMACIR